MAKGVAKKNGEKSLYRTVKFEIFPTPEQCSVLQVISANLCKVWNEAWNQRTEAYIQFLKPIYDRIKDAKKKAEEEEFGEIWKKELMKASNRELKKHEVPVRFISEKESLLKELRETFQEHGITLFDQINALTGRRNEDEHFAMTPRTFQEETLDNLDGSFKSFLALRKAGDIDAKPPRERTGENRFYVIPGRFGFSVKDDEIHISLGQFGDRLVAKIPDYQQEKLNSAAKVKKFILYRDESDLAKPGKFWVSVSYEIPKPKEQPFLALEAVYLAIGASSIGVVSPKGECVVKLWRSDKHWKPRIDQVDKRLKKVTKGSRKWRKLTMARQKMFHIMSCQQKQNRREVVQRLLSYGPHFVVTDLVVRSKPGTLADASKPERGGSLGLNWMAQNTGSIAYLVAWLKEKAREHGGTVQKYKLPLLSSGIEIPSDPEGRKIFLARKLREDFLASLL